MNYLKTTLLLGSLTGLLMAIGYAIGGQMGMTLMLLVSAGMNLFTWFFSDSMVIRSTGAVEIPYEDLPWLHDDIAELAKKANMPKPRILWTPDPSPNAFATGRSPSKGVVAVTAGLLETLDRREIRGVMAHELGHIKNRDTLISAIAATIAGAITWAAYSVMFGSRNVNIFVRLGLMILAPMAAMVLRMAISRTREYAADKRAAQLTGDPNGLADALEGLSSGVQRQPAMAGQESVHMAVNGFTGGMSAWMSTHPPTEERVRRLRQMEIR